MKSTIWNHTFATSRYYWQCNAWNSTVPCNFTCRYPIHINATKPPIRSLATNASRHHTQITQALSPAEMSYMYMQLFAYFLHYPWRRNQTNVAFACDNNTFTCIFHECAAKQTLHLHMAIILSLICNTSKKKTIVTCNAISTCYVTINAIIQSQTWHVCHTTAYTYNSPPVL